MFRNMFSELKSRDLFWNNWKFFLVLWFGTTLINVGFSRHSGSLTQTGTVSHIATTRLSIYGKITFSTLLYKIYDAWRANMDTLYQRRLILESVTFYPIFSRFFDFGWACVKCYENSAQK